MDRTDPLQRRGDGDAPFRQVVDWEANSAGGVLLRTVYPPIGWLSLAGLFALLLWVIAAFTHSLGAVDAASRVQLGAGVAAGAVLSTALVALLSRRPVRRGPPLGWIVASPSPHARAVRLSAVAAGTILLGIQLVVAGFAPVTDPLILALAFLSILPAFGLVAFLRYTDVRTPDPTGLLVGIYVLGIVLANLAAMSNDAVEATGAIGAVADQTSGAIAVSLYFLLVVAPVEELLKLLAGSISTYRSAQFDAVAAGVLYGAVAGLGFATIENTIFITREVTAATSGAAAVADGGAVTVGRAFAGPGHVVWSGLAGYYLGLARFNSRFAGPLVLKGLGIAAVLHGVYNISVQFVLGPVADALSVPAASAFVTFAVAYHGLVFGFLLYKLLQYRDAHRDALDGAHIESELTEFDP